MKVAIKGIQMPDNCLECPFMVFDEGTNETYCPFTKVICLNIGRQDACPLVDLDNETIENPEEFAKDTDYFCVSMSMHPVDVKTRFLQKIDQFKDWVKKLLNG